MYHISKFNFGFEYETLVETKNELFKPWITCKKTTTDPLCNNFKVGKNINRYILASYLNYKSKSKLFKARITAIDGAINDCLPKELLKSFTETQQNDDDATMINTNLQPISHWVITHDGSVTYHKDTMYKTLFEDPKSKIIDKIKCIENIEIVSPKLNFDSITKGEFETVLNETLKADNSFDYWNCVNTSNHVHFSCGNAFTDPNNLLKAAMAWWYFEPLFFLMVSSSRRKNPYCESIHSTIKARNSINDIGKVYTDFNSLTSLQAIRDLNREIPISGSINQSMLDLLSIILYFQNGVDKPSRYKCLNLLNIIGTTGTVEVRLKHGSSDAEENKNWILLLGYFFSSVLQYNCISEIANEELKNAAWMLNEEFDKFEKSTQLTPDLSPVVNFMFENFWQFLSISGDVGNIRTYFTNHLKNLHQPPLYVAPSSGGSKPSKLSYLFSYGSNSSKQLKTRIKRKGPFEIQPAYLADHIRIFAGYSKKWSGAVASVYPQLRKNVYGSLVKVSKNELEILDGFEKGYTRVRKTLTIQDDNNNRTTVQAFVYVKNDVSFEVLPSIKYLQAISDMLSETDRKHKEKIMIRTINKKTDRSTILGHWTPRDGMVINQ